MYLSSVKSGVCCPQLLMSVLRMLVAVWHSTTCSREYALTQESYFAHFTFWICSHCYFFILNKDQSPRNFNYRNYWMHDNRRCLHMYIHIYMHKMGTKNHHVMGFGGSSWGVLEFTGRSKLHSVQVDSWISVNLVTTVIFIHPLEFYSKFFPWMTLLLQPHCINDCEKQMYLDITNDRRKPTNLPAWSWQRSCGTNIRDDCIQPVRCCPSRAFDPSRRLYLQGGASHIYLL